MRHTLHRQRGAVAIMVALALLVLLSLVGLVVDGGMAYMVKARLNAAVDSAALAAARAVTAGNNQAEQRASAQAAAARFFAANIADGYLLSKPKLTATDVTFSGGTVTIDVRAEAPMPVSVMQVMGFTALSPGASAQTIRRDLDMAFVVDTSGSLSPVQDDVRAAAKSFLNKFNVTQDRVALIHFAYGADVDNAINTSARGFNRKSMLANIDGYPFTGSTASVEGVWQARNQLNAIAQDNRSVLRVIVFFSDGVPNALGGKLTFDNPGDCTQAGVFDSSGNGLFALTDSPGSLISEKCRLEDLSLRQEYRGIWNSVQKLPATYNAHPKEPNLEELPIVTTWPRAVTNDVSNSTIAARNIGRAARNLPEAMAARARSEGIFVFTLGMGPDLTKTYDGEKGEDVLKCMANVANGPSRCFNPAQPVGMYCYAATEADLTPCFSRLASAILRIAK